MNNYEYAEAKAAVLRLKVPDYSQLDSRFGFSAEKAQHMCGVVSVKAVSDFYSETLSIPRLDTATIVDAYEQGRRGDEIMNSTQVNLLKAQGLTAWRRNWHAVGSDPHWLVENEGYDQSQFAAVDQQQHDEAAYTSKEEQAKFAIIRSLELGNPVIASVAKGFHQNKDDHHVVIAGIDYSNLETPKLIVMDPYHPTAEDGYITVEFDRFFDYFNYRAIFAKPTVSPTDHTKK